MTFCPGCDIMASLSVGKNTIPAISPRQSATSTYLHVENLLTAAPTIAAAPLDDENAPIL